MESEAENQTDQKKLWTIFCDVLGIDTQTPRDELDRRRLAAWDSLAHVNLLLTLDQHFQTKLAAEPATITCYAQLQAHIKQSAKPHKQAHKTTKNICFIGNCHAFSLFKLSARQLNTFKLYYHHVDHILSFVERHKDLTSIDRQIRFQRELPQLKTAFRHYLSDADILVYSQIFQLDGPLNCHLAAALTDHFNIDQLFFVPMPIPESFKQQTPRNKKEQRYLGKQLLTRERIKTHCPAAVILDRSPELTHSLQQTGQWLFQSSFNSAARQQSSFQVDLTHPQEELWALIVKYMLAPALGLPKATPQENITTPLFAARIQSTYESLLSATPEQGSKIFDHFFYNTIPNRYLEEALRRLWYTRPQLRFSLLKATLENRTSGLRNLLLRVNWCNRQDLNFNKQQLETMNRLLV